MPYRTEQKQTYKLFTPLEWATLINIWGTMVNVLPNETPTTRLLLGYISQQTLSWKRLWREVTKSQLQGILSQNSNYPKKPLARSWMYKSTALIIKSGLVFRTHTNGDRSTYTVNIVGALDYYMNNCKLTTRQVEFTQQLKYKAIEVMQKEGIDHTVPVTDKIMRTITTQKPIETKELVMKKPYVVIEPTPTRKLDNVVSIATAKSIEAKHARMLKRYEGPATPSLIVTFIRLQTNALKMDNMEDLNKRVLGKMSHYIKECRLEERNIYKTLADTIRHWKFIAIYLKELTKNPNILNTCFQFETFYNYRGYVSDFLIACKNDYREYTASEINDRLADLGVKQIMGQGHRIFIKNWNQYQADQQIREKLLVVDEEGNDITTEVLRKNEENKNGWDTIVILDEDGNDITAEVNLEYEKHKDDPYGFIAVDENGNDITDEVWDSKGNRKINSGWSEETPHATS